MNVGSQRKLRQNEIVFSVMLHRHTTPDTQKDPHTNHTGLQIQGSKDAPITQEYKDSTYVGTQLSVSDVMVSIPDLLHTN